MTETTTLIVRCSPKVTDPREMMTIIGTSLRSLWGDLEQYSFKLRVEVDNNDDDTNNNNNDSFSILQVKCPSRSSAEAVRAALTFVTLPPYMMEESSSSTKTTIYYRFDVIDVII